MGVLAGKHQPGSPSTAACGRHQPLPCREARGWERAEHPPAHPCSTPRAACAHSGPPQPIPTCHSKGQESGECRDAEELAEGAGGEEEEEEDGTGQHGHQ